MRRNIFRIVGFVCLSISLYLCLSDLGISMSFPRWYHFFSVVNFSLPHHPFHPLSPLFQFERYGPRLSSPL